MSVRIPRKPAKRDIRNMLTFMGGGTTMEKVESRKTGRQNEAQYDKTIGEWGRAKGGELHKNRRGMAQLPGGGMFPYGLGPPGTLDRIGFIPVRITAEMLGRVLPIYCEIEAKTDTGRLQENQQQRIEHLRDHNCITGVAYGEATLEHCEQIFERWKNK